MSIDRANEPIDGGETVFETEWFSIVREHPPELPELDGAPYYLIDSRDSVMVLALTDAREVVLVEQFRPATGRATLELPSGYVGAGETPDRAAERELLEETGFRCSEIKSLGSGRLMSNRYKPVQYGFFRANARRVQAADAGEGTKAVLVDLERFKGLVLTGEFDQLAGLAMMVHADWRFEAGLLS